MNESGTLLHVDEGLFFLMNTLETPLYLLIAMLSFHQDAHSPWKALEALPGLCVRSDDRF